MLIEIKYLLPQRFKKKWLKFYGVTSWYQSLGLAMQARLECCIPKSWLVLGQTFLGGIRVNWRCCVLVSMLCTNGLSNEIVR